MHTPCRTASSPAGWPWSHFGSLKNLACEDAWKYFREEQLADETYTPFIGNDDAPAIEKNADIMSEYKERLEPFYYDASKYDTYLEQLGIDYPQLTDPDSE